MALGTALSGYLFGWGTIVRLCVVTFPLIGFCGIWACIAAVPHSVLGIARLMTLQALCLAASHLGLGLFVGGYAMGRHGRDPVPSQPTGRPPGGWAPMMVISFATLVTQSLAAWQLTQYADILHDTPLPDWRSTPCSDGVAPCNHRRTPAASVAGSIADALAQRTPAVRSVEATILLVPPSNPPSLRVSSPPGQNPSESGSEIMEPVDATAGTVWPDCTRRMTWGGLTKPELVYGTMETPSEGCVLISTSPWDDLMGPPGVAWSERSRHPISESEDSLSSSFSQSASDASSLGERPWPDLRTTLALAKQSSHETK
ncbi:hypothetical protein CAUPRSCDRAFT_11692 [Caulochytrium protostelioides]|uniref:Uncharacterized protein n=1 Tax=Caulochytrium protostelioides TaxID=1555241 RepID=A0A4P9WYM0_9FUNG|nr:hypothetical protein CAUPRSCDRAFT_11692 [Caulochytrium protostelioides]